MAITEKSTIFVLSLWNLLKIIISWVLSIARIFAWLEGNCGFLSMDKFWPILLFFTHPLTFRLPIYRISNMKGLGENRRDIVLKKTWMFKSFFVRWKRIYNILLKEENTKLGKIFSNYRTTQLTYLPTLLPYRRREHLVYSNYVVF